MKRIIIFALVLFVFFSSNVFSISATTDREDSYTYIKELNFERLYDEEGNLISEQILDNVEYSNRVEALQNARNSRAQSRMNSNAVSNNAFVNTDSDTDKENIITEEEYSILSNPPALEPIDDGGGGSSSDYCHVNSEICEEELVYDAEYTTHKTVVKVYPNNISPYEPTIQVDSTLTWDIMPTYRMVDVMSVSYDGGKFDVYDDSIEAEMSADKYYYRYHLYEDTTEYNDNITTSFNINDTEIEAFSDGVIFNADISEFSDTNYQDEWYGVTYIHLIEEYSNLTINLSFDLILKEDDSINDTSLNSTRLQAEYVHFWESISLNPSFNAGISFSGPSAGISIDAEKHTNHDGARTNYFQFLFDRR